MGKLKWGAFALFLWCSAAVMGQSQLAFNQVKIITSVADTVPVGKVWKITGVTTTIANRGDSPSGPHSYTVLVNGATRYIGHTAGHNNDANDAWGIPASIIGFESFWLPAGYYLAASSYIGEISVIEFNVIP